jgi:hypothetical protein
MSVAGKSSGEKRRKTDVEATGAASSRPDMGLSLMFPGEELFSKLLLGKIARSDY